MRELINKNDYKGVQQALSVNPGLANEGLPYDEMNIARAHPLHRIADGVFAGKFTDAEAVEMAKLFLAHGADINGGEMKEKADTPLIAAASLHADQLAIFYVEQGANIYHAGCHGGTALHWAAWCGRPDIAARLVAAGAAINQRCIDFTATPLFWAVHGLKKGYKNDVQQYVACVKILVQAGADKAILNVDGNTAFDLLSDEDVELRALLK